MSVQLKVSANGRIVIPADVRARLGIEDGSKILLEETEDGLMLTTLAQRIRKLQRHYAELTKDSPPFTVDDMIRERRAAAAQEEAGYQRLHGHHGD
jgi:AbrB family looped-hinge helix DNA binding protein